MALTNKYPEWSEELSRGSFKVSTLMVCKSAAGYYIGRICAETDEESDGYMGGMSEPYSRESDYYPSEESAQSELENGFLVRDCIENNHAYAKGTLRLGAE